MTRTTDPRRSRLLAAAVVLPLIAGLAACSSASAEGEQDSDQQAAAEKAGLEVNTTPNQDRIHTTKDDAAIALLPDAYKDADTLKVAVSAYVAPLAFLADDEKTPIGNETDIAQLVGDALGKKVEWQVTAWADWPLALSSGKVDAIVSNVTVTEERKETIDFSSYRNDELGWLVTTSNKNVPAKIEKPADIAGLTVAVGSGTNQEKILLEWDKENVAAGLKKVNIEYFENDGDTILALQSRPHRHVVRPERDGRLQGRRLAGRVQGHRHPQRRLAVHGADRRRHQEGQRPGARDHGGTQPRHRGRLLRQGPRALGPDRRGASRSPRPTLLGSPRSPDKLLRRAGRSRGTLTRRGAAPLRAGRSSMAVDHVVVGGGVMGAAAAWQLARRGREVVLLERFGPGHDRGASHGSSRIYRTTYASDDYLDLRRRRSASGASSRRSQGADVLHLTGGVSHGLGRDDVARHRRRRSRRAACRSRGCRPTRRRALARPAVRGPGAARERDRRSGPRRPGRRGLPGRRRRARRGRAPPRLPVRSVQQSRRRAWSSTPTTDRSRPAPSCSRRARGPPVCSARRLPPLVVTQEQPAHFAFLPVGPRRPTTGRCSPTSPASRTGCPSGTYGLAVPGEGVKVGFHGVGPVTDPDRRTFQPEPGQLAALRDYVRAWIPGADPDHLVPISCTYTTTPDHDFVLDRRDRIVVAAGFSGHGFKFAPAIGRLLADLATDDDARSAPRFALAAPRLPVPTPRPDPARRTTAETRT